MTRETRKRLEFVMALMRTVASVTATCLALWLAWRGGR